MILLDGFRPTVCECCREDLAEHMECLVKAENRKIWGELTEFAWGWWRG